MQSPTPTHLQSLTQTYLLRSRLVFTDATGRWHFVLVHTHTGARRGFADLEALITFLREEFSSAARLGDG